MENQGVTLNFKQKPILHITALTFESPYYAITGPIDRFLQLVPPQNGFVHH